MKLSTEFDRVKFPAEVVEQAVEQLRALAPGKPTSTHSLGVSRGRERFTLNTLDEWYAEYARGGDEARAFVDVGDRGLIFSWSESWGGHCSVDVSAPTRPEVERLMRVFTACEANHKLPTPPAAPAPKPPPVVVYIGHGHSPDWRIIKDELQDKHGYRVEAYEVGARAGHTIRDVLNSMLSKSSFALLVMTAEDDTTDGSVRARQNVVHEAGLFQGHLGFNRAIAVIESGVDVFSNLDGVQQIRYTSGQVISAMSEILATIRREFVDRR